MVNPELDIVDFIITDSKDIVVADASQSRIIYYQYSMENEVTITKVVGLSSKPLALAYSPSENSLFVGTRQGINEHDASDPSILRSTY